MKLPNLMLSLSAGAMLAACTSQNKDATNDHQAKADGVYLSRDFTDNMDENCKLVSITPVAGPSIYPMYNVLIAKHQQVKYDIQNEKFVMDEQGYYVLKFADEDRNKELKPEEVKGFLNFEYGVDINDMNKDPSKYEVESIVGLEGINADDLTSEIWNMPVIKKYRDMGDDMLSKPNGNPRESIINKTTRFNKAVFKGIQVL